MSNDFFRDKNLKGLLVSKVKVGKQRIAKNRDFSVISACASVKPCSLIVYKTNWHKRPPTFINREFAGTLFKTHRFRENLAFSICSLFGRDYADDNIIRTLLYYKRINSHFSFLSSYERSECFIFGVITENASQRNEMQLLHLKRRFYEALCAMHN